MKQRSLRYTDDKSDKFWRITLEGAAHTVSYGRVGTTGRTQQKEFASEAAAETSFEKLVAAKLKKGYVEIQKNMDTEVSSEEGVQAVPKTVANKKAISEQSIPQKDRSTVKTELTHPVSESSAADTSVEIPENWQALALEKLQGELNQNKKQLCELAAIDGIPETYFSILNLEVRKAIASQPCTPSTILEQLATDAHDAVRSALAKNASAPHACLEALAQDASQDVRYALTRNVYAPEAALCHLVEEPYEKIIKSACENPNVTEPLLDQLSKTLNDHQKHSCSWKRIKALKQRDAVEPKTPWDQWLRSTKQRQQGFPKTNWEKLTFEDFEGHKNNPSYRMFMVQSPQMPASLLSKLGTRDEGYSFSSPSPVVGSGFLCRDCIREAVACNPSTPVDVLQQLLETNNLFICMALARNHELPKHLFLKLFENNDYLYPFDQGGRRRKWEEFKVGDGPGYEKWLHDLHWELARNPNTPTSIIEKLAQHNASYVKEMARKQSRDRALKAAMEPDASKETLKSLLKHRDIRVRVAVAKTEKGVPLFLDTCLKDSKTLGRFIALMHPDINQNVISKTSSSPKWSDRYAITQNPSTPTEWLSQLSTDESILVQAAAKTALKIPFATTNTEAELPDSQESEENLSTSKELADVQEPNGEVKVPDNLEVPHVITLSAEEQQWVTWYPRQPLPLPDPKEFDVSFCEKRRAKVEKNKWDWAKAQLSITMTTPEAHYWIAEMLADTYRPKLETDPGSQSLLTILERSLGISATPYSQHGNKLSPSLAVPLHIVFGIGEVINKVVELAALPRETALDVSRPTFYSIPYNEHKLKCTYDKTFQYYGSGFDEVYKDFMRWTSGLTRHMVQGFRRYIYPYLAEAEIKALADQLLPLFTQPIPPSLQEALFHLAAFLDMQDVVAYEVALWEKANYYSHQHHIHWASHNLFPSLVFRLKGAEQVEHHLRRLNIFPRTPLEIKLCVATTGFNTSDLICKRIGSSQKYQLNELMSSWLAAGTASEMAPYMLELALASKVSKTAMQWLEDNVVCAIVGLIPVAANAGPSVAIVKKADLVDAAQRFLVGQVRKGQAGIIQAALKDFPETVAHKITQEVLNHVDLTALPFDAQTTPDWLKQAIAQLPSSNPSISISPADLPHIILGRHCLTVPQGQRVLQALKLSTPNSPLDLIPALKQHATSESLDAFVWALFERWLAEGSYNKEKWAMLALGLLGSDEIALKLTPLIRKWPGESQHSKARNGLECLRAIGSDTALMQINGIAQKIKYKGLQQRARECMDDIARDRNFTPEQLEDRIIPDCGLNAQGQRVFDFGPRHFQFVLGPDLKPFVRDAKGKLRTTLPKPNQQDDAELAKQAAAEWKLMKKQISGVVKLQAIRLEQAMVTERQWPLNDFQTLLVNHPLMTHLVQRLVWSGYDAEGTLVETFRVAEDCTLANAQDEEVELESNSVNAIGIIHPLCLDEDARSAWGEVFSDYEIMPPFPQLHREIYTLTPEEADAPEIQRFVSTKVPGVALARMMDNQGWRKGALHDHGDYRVHYKYFERANVTAIVGDYEYQHTQQSSIYGDDLISSCLFLVGYHPEPYEYPRPDSWYGKQLKAEHVNRLGDVDPIVISEVLRDLTAIANANTE